MNHIQKLKFVSVAKSLRSVMVGLPLVALCLVLAATLGAMLPAKCHAAVMYDQNVTPEVIFGSGNTNGSWTVDRNNGIEVGLRGKLRHDANGSPANIFNSNGDGTYSFSAGVAPTQSAPTAVWSFEWSVNTDYMSTSGNNLDGYSYRLGLDSDPTGGTNFATVWDPINVNQADHALGTNGTSNGAGFVATSAANYQGALGAFNVAQQSWKPHWFMGGFDPTLDATYDIYFEVLDGAGASLARTDIQIIAGAGGAAPIPEPTTVALLGIGIVGLAGAEVRRRRKKKAIANL